MPLRGVIERLRQEPPFAPPGSPFPDLRYVCKVLDPVPWNRGEVERELGIEVPPALAELWNLCGGLILYEDDTFRQRGLVVRAPPDPDVFILNREYREDYPKDALPGDLIFARFWGDRERPLFRCDKTAADYGTIVIVAEMDSRDEWSTAAHSLEEFLIRFMDANGEKYWDYHYQQRLAERAAKAN
jgi:hypothetical protein